MASERVRQAIVLDRIARRERDASISKKVDEVLASLLVQDTDTSRVLLAARKDEGTEWHTFAEE